ncbi:efflux RND transporter permease subunit [Kosmotoga pacifica]|uniref:Acriflavin resistance protein n=1 Tax=Kosmotoga pacifica TaxID=1330330 RepID=A0A0G2ZCK6_9BACT|nr:efflux RND transporter permease subunit [Kosmotoga pacifica]AKI97831.1 hypothetical protein IX53_08420 [Kosmotoga pacifica]
MWKSILSQFSRRPVAVFLLFSTLIFLGFFSWEKLPLDLLPNVDIPYAMVVTPYIGAGPEEVELNVTNPVESAVGLVSGIKSFSSRSVDGFSIVQIEFENGTDMNAAVSRIKQALESFAIGLPEGVDPIVIEFNPSMIPIYVLGISSSDGDIDETSLELQKRLSRVVGVANVERLGIPKKEVRITLDEEKLSTYGIPYDILQTVLSKGVRFPMGNLEDGDEVFNLSVSSQFESLDELKNTIIGIRGMDKMLSSSITGQSLELKGIPIPVRLKQVADVELVDSEIRGFVQVNDENAAVLVVQKQGGTNTVKVARGIKEAVDEWQNLHPNTQLVTLSDSGKFTEKAISGLFRNLIIGALVATIVIFIFLRNFTATLAIALSMPLSLLIAVILLYFSGLGLDLMTLGGLTMAVGMIVDNSIVVLEAIYRHLEEKRSPEEAAGKGGSEVVGAIFSSTLTTLAMFVPLAFITGFFSQFLKFFAIALALSLAASLLVAIVLVPAFSGFIKVRLTVKCTLENMYKKQLSKILKRKGTAIIVFVSIFVVGTLLMATRDFELIPAMDSGIINISVKLPENTSYKVTKSVTQEINKHILENSSEYQLDSLYVNGGVTGGVYSVLLGGSENTASIQLNLLPKRERSKTSQEIAGEIRKALMPLAVKHNAEIRVSAGGLEIENLLGSDIKVTFYGDDFQSLERVTTEFAEELKGVEGIVNVSTNFEEKERTLELKIDRGKAIMSGVIPMQIIGAIQPYTLGVDLGDIFINGKRVPLKLGYEPLEGGYQWLKKIPVNSMIGEPSYVGIVSKLDFKKTQKSIDHDNGHRVGYVRVDVSGRALSDVVKDVRTLLQKKKDLTQFIPEIGGQASNLAEALKQFGFAIVVGIIFMYLIIGAQFESLVYPFVIFLTLPMAIVGVAVVSMISGKPISIGSLMGVLTLIGVTVNNGIVMVTYINQLRERGMKLEEAIVEGAGRRLRPILMTSLTTVVALLPTIFSRAEGSELESPLALTIAGGLLFGVVFTLFLIPILYSIFDRLSLRFKK